MTSRSRLIPIVFAAAAFAACSPSVSNINGTDPGGGGGGITPPVVPNLGDDWGLEPKRLDYFEGLLTGEAQRTVLCARNLQDRVSKFMCPVSGVAPAITKIDDLLVGLGLKNLANPGNMKFAISGHSSSLVTRKTTSLNPRAVIFTQPNTVDYVAMGFVRGDGFAELVAFDPSTSDLNFFLVRIHKACDPECSNAERFGPAAESGWLGVTVYGDFDIKNTPLDCLQCHQVGGLTAPRILRMQELQDPWTHWFRDNRPSVALLNQFQAAHPNEAYAGIPANLIANSDPADLEDFVRDGGFGNQPNQFLTSAIAAEGPRGPTWMGLYNKALTGEMISVPFYEISPYDPAKVLTASAAYRAVIDGSATPDTMPDMTEIFRTDVYADLGFEAGAIEAKGIVMHRCGTCHNGQFPGISRNNFVAADFPDNLTPEMKAKVLQRITLPMSSRLRMPPLLFSELTNDQILSVQAALGAQ